MQEQEKDRLSCGKDDLEVLEHYGIKYRSEENPMIFKSSELAKAFIVLSCQINTDPRKFIIDFDPNYPFSVVRQMDMSRAALTVCDIDRIVAIVADCLGIKPLAGARGDNTCVDLGGSTLEEFGRVVAARFKSPENQGK